MPNLNVSLGLAQLEDIDRRLNAKQEIYQRYLQAFEGPQGAELVENSLGCRANHWLVSLRFTAEESSPSELQRSQLLGSAHASGYLLRAVWKLLQQLPMYQSAPRAELLTAEDHAVRLICQPSSPQLL